MAVDFDAAADRLLRTASLPSYDANYTVLFWVYMDTRPGTGVYYTTFAINDDTNDSDYIALVGNTASDTRFTVGIQEAGSFQEATGTTNLSPTTWYCIGLIRSATNSRIGYVGTLTSTLAQEANLTYNVVAGRTTPTRMEMGAIRSTNNDPLDGRVAYVKIWTAALSLAELQAEQYSILPKRMDNLHIWSPTFPGDNVRNLDYGPNRYDWTASGTLTDAESLSIPWGIAPIFVSGVSTAVVTPVLEQEGYRWRNDDGSETTATWKAAQDTTSSVAASTNIRLRMIISASAGDPAASQYQLEYRKQGETTWKKVITQQ